MDRPYIICHMLTSANNKITGAFMFRPETAELIKEYGRIDNEFNAPVWLCGKTTMSEFTGGLKPVLKENSVAVPREDYVAVKDAGLYVAVTDPEGELGYDKPYLERGCKKSFIIALLTEAVSDDYIMYLKNSGISYIFAGENKLDLEKAMHKLKSLFGFNTLISHGGGYTNGALLRASLIDELSLVRSPLSEDGCNEVSLFGSGEIPQLQFELVNVQKLKNGGERLRYKINGHKKTGVKL